MSGRVWGVAELTRRIRELLETEIDRVWVQGEISGFKVHPSSGHAYFSLKEQNAVLACVAWAPTVRALMRTVGPRDGMRVRLFGALTVYEQRGAYQIIVEQMLNLGEGDLQAAFQRLKLRLEAEGLFDAARKRPLPAFPRRIGVVTSPSGAAFQDMLRVLSQRWPMVEVVLRPAAVQGEGAAQDLARAVGDLNELGGCDLILLGRGGGSLEDLWAFNEEALARAIHASRVPVVSAVGHEIDFTISDFTADVRAATPSNAAEIAVPDRAEIRQRLRRDARFLSGALRQTMEQSRASLDRLHLSRGMRRAEEMLRDGRLELDRAADRMRGALSGQAERERQRVQRLEVRLSRAEPRARLQELRHLLESNWQRMIRLAQTALLQARGRLEAAGGSLDALGPESILARGYCILTRDADGAVVREASQVAAGDAVRARLSRGRLTCRVETAADEAGGKEAGV